MGESGQLQTVRLRELRRAGEVLNSLTALSGGSIRNGLPLILEHLDDLMPVSLEGAVPHGPNQLRLTLEHPSQDPQRSHCAAR